jgi:hypothetical protein
MKNHTVYIYRDRANRVLYVGITHRLTGRQDDHTAKEWWPLVHKSSYIHCGDDRRKALAIERILIENLNTVYNITHNPGGRDVSYTPPPMEDPEKVAARLFGKQVGKKVAAINRTTAAARAVASLPDAGMDWLREIGDPNIRARIVMKMPKSNRPGVCVQCWEAPADDGQARCLPCVRACRGGRTRRDALASG